MSVALYGILFAFAVGGFTRRLRRPTAGASHAPSGAANPFCRAGGLFAQEVRRGEGRFFFRVTGRARQSSFMQRAGVTGFKCVNMSALGGPMRIEE